MKYTAEEVESLIAEMNTAASWSKHPYGRAPVRGASEPMRAEQMLREYAALLREQAKDAQGEAVHTVASLRKELVAKVGDCCMGGDPACSAGCLFEKAVKRNAHHTAPRAAMPDGWRVNFATGKSLRLGDRWEIYDPSGTGGVVNLDYVKEHIVRKFLDALSAAPSDGGEQGEQHE